MAILKSLCKADYIIVFDVMKKTLWIACFIKELYQTWIYQISIYCNNQSTIVLFENLQNYQQTKHIDMGYHYIFGNKKGKIIAIKYLILKD